MNGTKMRGISFLLLFMALSARAAFVPQQWTTNSFLYGLQSLTNLDNDTFIRMQLSQEAGNIFSNFNRYAWTNTQASVRANKQWVLMLNGDGLGSAVSIQSNFWHGSFTNFFPVAGIILGIDFPTWTANVNVVNGGLAVPAQDPLWLQGWTLLGNQNSNVVFQGNVVNPSADFGVVYYVEESTAGHILIETNLGGGAFATVSGLGNVDCSGGAYSLGAGTMIARWVTWTNPSPAPIQIRVTELDSGKAVKVLGAGYINRTITNGIIEANWQAAADCGWSNNLTTNVNVFGNYLKFVNPKLVLSEHLTWDGGTDPGGSEQYFQPFRDMIKTNLPFADHVLTGVYPADTSPNQSTNSYRQLTNAQYYGLAYFDGTSPLVDVATMTNRSFSPANNIAHALPAGVGAYDALLQYWLDLTSAPSPAQYPFWLTGQQPEWLYQIDYVPGPTAQGNKMSYFLDLSGKGRDVFGNFGASFFPVWTNNATIINGKSWAWFPSGGALLSRQLPTSIAQPFTTWAVIKADTIAGNVWLSSTNAGNATAMTLADNNMGTGANNIPYTLNPGQWYIMESVWNGTTSYFRTNAGPVVTGNAGAITMGTITVGSGIDNGGKIQGGIAFLATYAGLPSTNFEAQMFTSLNNYYQVYTSGQTNVLKGVIASGTTVLVAGKVTVTPTPLLAVNNTNAFVASILGTNINNFVNISNVIDNTSFQIISSDAGATNRVYWQISKP